MKRENLNRENLNRELTKLTELDDKMAEWNRILSAAAEAHRVYESISWWQFRAKAKARRTWFDLVKLSTTLSDETHALRRTVHTA